jgi:hypothetical protein
MADDNQELTRIGDQLVLIVTSLKVMNQNLLAIQGDLEKIALKMPSGPPGNVTW